MAAGIRRLGPGDLPDMRALLTLFGTVFADPQSYGGAPPDDPYLARLLGRSQFIALVAAVEGQVVGGLAAYELEKFEQARSEIYLYDLAVAAAHRRQGIARALIRRLQCIGAQCGAWTIFVQADRGDDPAIALYAGLGAGTGAGEDVLHFDIPVPPEDTARGS